MKRAMNETKKYTEYPLNEMLDILVTLSEQQWGGYAFYHEPLERRFTEEQKKEYVKKACYCGREEADKIKAKHRGCSVREIITSLGVKIDMPDTPSGGGHVVFAQYIEPDEIVIFDDCIKKVEVLIKEKELNNLLAEGRVEELLMAHELFHVLEYREKNSIYTQTEKIELWRRPFSNKSRILALSEMAAMAFAGRLMELEFSPYILDVILMYCYNKEVACALYEEILEATGIKERED